MSELEYNPIWRQVNNFVDFIQNGQSIFTQLTWKIHLILWIHDKTVYAWMPFVRNCIFLSFMLYIYI